MAEQTTIDTNDLPIVHSNGTNRENLMEQRANVIDALREADKALAAMAPNGRDYYTDPGRMDRALALHKKRQDMIGGLIKELEAEMDYLYFD